MTDEEKSVLLHKDSFNYDLNENEYTGTIIEEEKRRRLKNYLMENSFNIGSLEHFSNTL